METNDSFAQRQNFSEVQEKMDAIKNELHKVIVGQDQMIELLLAAILARGHVLIEGVPGLAKTLTARLLAHTIDADFKRLQFTPDLMPSDILGTSVYNFKTSEFEFKKGPLFTNLVLIDEINRSPAKTQSALFEVMEERQITVEGNRFVMQDPYMIIATQNPIDMEGTYRLPEAQMDRFLFRIKISYPTVEEETAMLRNAHAGNLVDPVSKMKRVLSAEDIRKMQGDMRNMHVEEHLFDFITDIVHKTRSHADILLGGSPRATLSILAGAKALGLLRGRDFVTPDDILDSVGPVMSHRVLITAEKEMEGSTSEEVMKQLLTQIEIPK